MVAMHRRRRKTIGGKNRSPKKGLISLSSVILYAVIGLGCFYIAVLSMIANHSNEISATEPDRLKHDDRSPESDPSKTIDSPQKAINSPSKTIDSPPKAINSPSKTIDSPPKAIDSPPKTIDSPSKTIDSPSKTINSPPKAIDSPSKTIGSPSKTKKDRILTAYLEPIDESQWEEKPLPRRTSTAEDLKSKKFPEVNSCSKFIQQLPVDQYPDDDPFLPWIHDVFPSHDGKFIQVVAQNRRRCNTGRSAKNKEIHRRRGPQLSLFENVAVKRVRNSDSDSGIRYRLSSHEEADEDGTATRFICRFSNGEETLSVFNFSYEWASVRKRQSYMFHEHESDNKQIHTSQLLFRCPVPESLVESVRTGASVVDDFATIFFDLVPIRTPPRYGPPNEFLPPYYKEFLNENPFDATKEWGTNHVLPKIEDSGRWQNIPVCKPSLLTYGKQSDDVALVTPADSEEIDAPPIKQHRLVSCLWASAGYSTRGERFAINDGQRRLLEWVTYNKMTGVEHFYLYDNSEAHSPDVTLKFIADLFPDDVTIINWPSKICNNNQNNVDNPGERSSQYAAEASCRLRFGPHTEWIAQFDIDEYLVPMGELTSLHPLLDKLDEEGTKIISFGSWRAWPRRKFIEDPYLSKMSGAKDCGSRFNCFQLTVPKNYTMLQAYNCDRQKPGQKKDKMPAEKQIYRADYVLHHFIHYSTVTALSNLNREDYEKLGRRWNSRSPFPDPLSRFGDENIEALMLHTKAVAHQDTANWDHTCLAEYEGSAYCRLGNPFPDDLTGVDVSKGLNGLKYNCYLNHKIDDYWVKNLEDKLKEYVPELAERIAAESSSTSTA